jgi:protein-S-isoprenylcysteine O-methyltransferase Ste14
MLPNITPKFPNRSTSRSESVSRGLSLFFDHLGPAVLWAIIPLCKVASLIGYLAQEQAAHPAILIAAFIVQQVLTIGFGVLVVVLFLARRPVVGQRASASGRIVAMAGTFALQIPGAYPVPDDQLGRLLASSALIAIGMGIAISGIVSLRRNFGIFPEARGLVTNGLYRYVRHPLYLGEMIAGLGLTLGTTWLPAFGLFAVQCGLLYWRTVLEERALTASFPAYPDYRRRTCRLIPGIY